MSLARCSILFFVARGALALRIVDEAADDTEKLSEDDSFLDYSGDLFDRDAGSHREHTSESNSTLVNASDNTLEEVASGEKSQRNSKALKAGDNKPGEVASGETPQGSSTTLKAGYNTSGEEDASITAQLAAQGDESLRKADRNTKEEDAGANAWSPHSFVNLASERYTVASLLHKSTVKLHTFFGQNDIIFIIFRVVIALVLIGLLFLLSDVVRNLYRIGRRFN